jgi:ABC-type amino acid transport substrate-binding protein
LVIVVTVIGYFADPKINSQINSVLGINKTTQQVSKSSVDQPKQEVTKQASGKAMSTILANGSIRVGVQTPSKPFYDTSGGKPQGFNVDFMKILFAQSEFGNVKADTSTTVDTYADLPKLLMNGDKVDMIIDGLTFNDEDHKGVVYSIPYVKDFGYSLITTKGNNIQNVSDTVGMNIGILKGDTDVRAFAEQTFPDAKLVELSDKPDASGKWIVGHIKSKHVDAVVYDYPFAVAEVEDTDLQFAMSKIKGSDIQYRIGVKQSDKDLLVALNSAIRKTMNDDAYPEMLKKYFMSNKVAAVRRVSSGETSYVVVKGDTLSTIASTLLGDKMKYAEIQTRNNLANPNFIAVGQKLVIPQK